MKIGFIGCGNMGEAMLNGILNSNIVNSSDIYVHTNSQERMDLIVSKYQVNQVASNQDVAKLTDFIILGTKPDSYPIVINEIKALLNHQKVLISITPSYTLDVLKILTNDSCHIIRTIPNTPAIINQGMTGMSFNKDIPEALLSSALKIFKSFGDVIVVEESKLSVLSTLSGSSPAFIFLFLKSFIAYGKANGFTDTEIKQLVGQTLKGSASLFQEKNIDIDTLINQVCSKGGSTIEGINHLVNHDFTNIVKGALENTTKRFNDMVKKTEEK